jgi:hypothetical protein
MRKGTLRTIVGDATDPQRSTEDEVVVIPHVCNDLGGFGAGFVLAIDKKWPEPKQEYKLLFERCPNDKKLGRVQLIQVESDIYIANMISQHGYIGKDNPRPLRYVELITSMCKLVSEIKHNFSNEQIEKIVFHCPKFGSQLAGGNFDFVLDLIDEIWLENGFDVVVYQFKG